MTRLDAMKSLHSGLLATLLSLALIGCTPMLSRDDTYDKIQGTLEQGQRSAKAENAAVNAALLPPIRLAPPPVAKPLEPRFDLAVREAPAAQVFLALVNGTHYSMLLPPDITGSLTLNLKNVTVLESLDVIRELYGYDFKIQGSRISVQPNTPQTRIFQVSYLASKRGGTSSTRVISSNTGSSNGSSGASGSGGSALENTSVFTGQVSDFWLELSMGVATALNCEYELTQGGAPGVSGSPASAMVNQMMGQHLERVKCPEGRRFLLNQQSGVIMVRALPSELREVGEMLKAMQAGVERQVMLEAKLIEVELSDGFQSGVNWANFDSYGRQRWGLNANTSNTLSPAAAPAADSTLTGTSGILSTFTAAGALGLSFQTGSFAAIIDFLETQGSVYVMSSPRIATLNNQKAVLKVGTDDYYVTNVTPPETTNSGGTVTTNPPTITTQPFFSGIALDVTPQIDDSGNITLHIRPSITEVTEKDKTINFGEQGTYTLPYASTKVKETDSIVRVRDGMIVAIGGLMSQGQSANEARIPGIGEVPFLSTLFKQANRAMSKKEMVVLIKPTVIREQGDWQPDMEATNARLRDFDPRKLPVLAEPPVGPYRQPDYVQ